MPGCSEGSLGSVTIQVSSHSHQGQLLENGCSGSTFRGVRGDVPVSHPRGVVEGVEVHP